MPAETRIDFALTGPSTAQRPLTKPVAGFRPSLDLGREVDQLLLRRFAPAGVVLNSAMDILEFRGTTSSFIEPKSGGASLNIFKMMRQELVTPLRVALQEARLNPKPVVKREIEMQAGGHARKIDLEVMRLRPESTGPTYYLVLFEEHHAAVAKNESRKSLLPRPTRTDNLERELKSTQEHLKSIVDEQGNTNQELQSANEEILASNEELQSMNEEMQTAKEELQATNEELHSVNDELQKRNADLGEVNGDLSNLILSLDIASVLVDNNLHIRRFTPLAQQLLNLIPSDVGRSIRDIRPKIELPDWPHVIADVLRTMAPFEGEIQDSEGHWYSMRIRPYRTEAFKIEGAVMFLVDIDKVKRAEAAVRQADEKLRKLVEQLPDFVLDPDGQILFVNPTPLSLAKDAKIGTSITEAVAAPTQTILKTCLEKVRKTGEPSAFPAKRAGAALETVITPIKSGDNVVAMMMSTRQ
jgi:two-component system, chemotaxis family, CheB/CheR fusion protein